MKTWKFTLRQTTLPEGVSGWNWLQLGAAAVGIGEPTAILALLDGDKIEMETVKTHDVKTIHTRETWYTPPAASWPPGADSCEGSPGAHTSCIEYLVGHTGLVPNATPPVEAKLVAGAQGPLLRRLDRPG